MWVMGNRFHVLMIFVNIVVLVLKIGNEGGLFL